MGNFYYYCPYHTAGEGAHRSGDFILGAKAEEGKSLLRGYVLLDKFHCIKEPRDDAGVAMKKKTLPQHR
jgi:hypothetical protein